MLELHIKQGLKLLCEAQAQDSDQMPNLLFVKDNQSENPFFPSVLTSLNSFL